MMKELKIGNLEFKNPVLTASGTFGMGDLYQDFFDYNRIGGIILKTVTMSPRKGNPPQRILETPAGMMNSIGLENAGYKAVLKELKLRNDFKEMNTRVIFSISGDSISDFSDMIKGFSEIEGISAFELNLSCPNVEAGGKNFDSNHDSVQKIVCEAVKSSEKPFSVKLSPHNDFVTNSKIVEDNGGQAVTISNTFLGMAIDLKTKDFVFKNKIAGFSGPAVKPMALYNVYRAANAVKIPVIASGGISSADDAKEFLIAGAAFVSIGTMNFVEPDLPAVIADSLIGYEY